MFGSTFKKGRNILLNFLNCGSLALPLRKVEKYIFLNMNVWLYLFKGRKVYFLKSIYI